MSRKPAVSYEVRNAVGKLKLSFLRVLGVEKRGEGREPSPLKVYNDTFCGEVGVKNNVIRSKRKVGFDTAGAARSWLDLGIQPVPLYPKSKRPSGGKGWTTLKVNGKDLNGYFKNGQNLGGLWGEPSGWIVDVDLDWDEAVTFAGYYLPETFVYGRRSRPESHPNA